MIAGERGRAHIDLCERDVVDRLQSLACALQHSRGCVHTSQCHFEIKQMMQHSSGTAAEFEDWISDHFDKMMDQRQIVPKLIVLEIIEVRDVSIGVEVVGALVAGLTQIRGLSMITECDRTRTQLHEKRGERTGW